MVESVQERLAELKATVNKDKIILDATSAFRSMWFNKNHPLVDYFDKSSDNDLNKRRERYNNLCGTTKFKYWNPKNTTIQGTWDKLPFKDNSKKLIVFDPPHKTSYTGSQRCKFKEIYGFLRPETQMKQTNKQGFSVECSKLETCKTCRCMTKNYCDCDIPHTHSMYITIDLIGGRR